MALAGPQPRLADAQHPAAQMLFAELLQSLLTRDSQTRTGLFRGLLSGQ